MIMRLSHDLQCDDQGINRCLLPPAANKDVCATSGFRQPLTSLFSKIVVSNWHLGQ